MNKKRLFPILFVLFAFILTGCNALKNAVTAKAPDLSTPFTCGFDVKLDEKTEIKGTMSRYGTGIWEMSLTEPETVAGLHLTYNDEAASVSLGELGFDIPQEKINDTAIFQLIFNAIDNFASQADAVLTETEEALEYNGEISQCSYLLTFDKESKQLTGVAFPDLTIAAEICDFSDITSESTTDTSTTETT